MFSHKYIPSTVMVAEAEKAVFAKSTSIISFSSHIQSMCVLCSLSVIQHSLISFSDSDGVSGPSDSGSRSSSGDTGEGELRSWSIAIIVWR